MSWYFCITHVHYTVRVSTKPRVTALWGIPEELPCDFDGNPDAIYWHHYNVSTDAGNLVARYFNGKREAVSYGYNITKDFSLVISNPNVKYEGKYSCQVAYFQASIEGINYTHVRVVARTNALTISDCDHISPRACEYTLPAISGSAVKFQATCHISGARPPLNITWYTSTGIELLRSDPSRDVTEENGLFNTTSIYQVSASNIGDEFECRAEGEAINGTVSVTMFVKGPPEEGGLSGGAIFAIVFSVFILVMLAVVAYTFYKLRVKSKGQTMLSIDEIECRRLQEEIKEYTPGKLSPLEDRDGRCLPTKTRLAVFGVTSAGKSSLVRSFRHAVQGDFLPVEVAQTQTAGGVTIAPKPYKITEYISFVDNRGLRDLDENLVPSIMKQIRGEDNQLHPGDCIDCPILVFDPRQPVNALEKFLPAFVDAIRAEYAAHPPVIFTHRDEVTERIPTITTRVTGIGALDQRLFFVENFTEEPSETCFDRNLEFLRILRQLLQHADENMVYRVDKRSVGAPSDPLLPVPKRLSLDKADGKANGSPNSKTSFFSRLFSKQM